MRKLKKLAASVAALATAAAMSVGTLAVTANEVKNAVGNSFAEKEFISSFDDADCTTVANYLISSGISLEDAEKIMELYVEGDKQEKNIAEKSVKMKKVVGQKSVAATGTVNNFYNTSRLSYCNHYGAIISNKGNAHIDSIDYFLEYTSPKISLSNASTGNIKKRCDGVNNLGTSFWISDINLRNIFANLNMNLPSYRAACVCDFPVDITPSYRSTTNEKEVHDLISFEADKGDSTSPAEFRFETYVIGDFNHDGQVDVRDLRLVANHSSGIANSIPNNYDDIDTKTAEEVNKLAADMNRDNAINADDVSLLTNYILTHPMSER